MSNHIQYIHIKNFKSISECKIERCNRINLFIGRPNVGKSNIIEALSLFTIPYFRENSSKSLTNLVRIENEAEIFYKGNYDNESFVETNIGECYLAYHPSENFIINISINNDYHLVKIDHKFKLQILNNSKDYDSKIKKYSFNQNIKYEKGHAKYLIPPFGQNLFSVITQYPKLIEEIKELFKETESEILFDRATQAIKLLQRVKGDIFTIPYSAIADTLQRVIFYNTAIETDQGGVLLFEEPEAHSFPPYMKKITQKMIAKKDSQFFIATHSPYIINELLENAIEEVAIFNVDIKDQQTVVHQLTNEELREINEYGVDLFTNNESYL